MTKKQDEYVNILIDYCWKLKHSTTHIHIIKREERRRRIYTINEFIRFLDSLIQPLDYSNQKVTVEKNKGE